MGFLFPELLFSVLGMAKQTGDTCRGFNLGFINFQSVLINWDDFWIIEKYLTKHVFIIAYSIKKRCKMNQFPLMFQIPLPGRSGPKSIIIISVHSFNNSGKLTCVDDIILHPCI